jgi:predicted Zn-dependent protease
MRSAFRFLTVAALALMLVSLGFAQNQTPAPPDPNATSNAPSNATSNPPAQDTSTPAPPDKPDKNAPPPGSLNNLDAIGNRNVGCNKGLGNWYSLDKQVAMGRQYSQMVEHGAKMVSDPEVTEYINRLGQNLVRNSDAKVPFTIKVIDTDDINAFALPGGFFYVNSGLILAADNEAELAGVMAHEIAHVAARHGTRQATRGELAQIGMIAASIAIPYTWTGYAVRQGMGLAIPMGFLAFTRGMEKEADYLGLQYMYKAGYDPTSFVDFFEKIQTMEKRKPGTVAKVFSTHPMTDDRIAASQKEIQQILVAKPEYVVNTSEFNDVKARLYSLHNHRKTEKGKDDPSRPTLRRSPGSGTGTVDDNDKTPADQDERPTLKRRDSDSGSSSSSSGNNN